MTANNIRLPGHKIILRDWLEADLPIYACWLQPGQKWYQFDAPYYPKPKAKDIPNIIEDIKINLNRGQVAIPRRRLVIAQKESNEFIGLVTWYWQSRETDWLSIGIVIHDDSLWGQGLGFEALGLWCDYLFQAMPYLMRLDLRTWSGNYAMIQLAKKVGFQEEARFRMARIVNGEYFDAIGYGILREEWQHLYPNGFCPICD